MEKLRVIIIKINFFQETEFEVSELIYKMEIIAKADESRFKLLIQNRKETNKYQKQQNQKLKTEARKILQY